MITKQTFEALAASIRRQVDKAHNMYDLLERKEWLENGAEDDEQNSYAFNAGMKLSCIRIAEDAADHFEQSNPRFDRARFMKACGLED